MMMVVPFSKVTKTHRIVHLDWVNFMIRKTYLHKALFKNAYALVSYPLKN